MALHPIRTVAGLAPHGVPGARHLIRSGLARMFGPPPFDPAADPGDPGLFGPGSASWQVLAEPAAIVGGVRALLVQLLHPHAMAGVADHSRFRTDPLGRLHRTSAYIGATVFGSTAEAVGAARAVRSVHRRVSGVAPDGVPYRASDPHLLRWVSIALTSSFLAADRAFAPRPLDAAAVDAFVDEQARAAALLDPRFDLDVVARRPEALAALRADELDLPLRDDGWLPRTGAQLRDVLTGYADELTVHAQGREAVRFLLWPPVGPVVRSAYLPLLAGALATLEPRQRRLLGVPASRVAARGVTVQTRALLAGMRLSVGTSPSAEAARRRATAAHVA